jgi:hypothetical protein
MTVLLESARILYPSLLLSLVHSFMIWITMEYPIGNYPIAVTYDALSAMEQHSFNLAFEFLMEDSYSELRAALYDTQEEFNRFLQLCINCVIATDVFDKDLKAFREDRWNRVLHGNRQH